MKIFNPLRFLIMIVPKIISLCSMKNPLRMEMTTVCSKKACEGKFENRPFLEKRAHRFGQKMKIFNQSPNMPKDLS